MNGDSILLIAAVVFAALALFATALILFLRALADTFAPVINYCANQPELGPIVGYWYDVYAPMTAAFFQSRTNLPSPGEVIPGKEGTDFGVIRGPIPTAAGSARLAAIVAAEAAAEVRASGLYAHSVARHDLNAAEVR